MALPAQKEGRVTYPPGMIGVATGEQGRWADFTPAAVRLAIQAPAGSKFLSRPGLGPARPFNSIAEEFLRDKELQWLFLTNDDNYCPDNTIKRLLDRQVDVVSGLYFNRLQPFEPILFDSVSIKDGRRWYNRHLLQPGESGMIPAAAVGDGCLLIQRYVMELLPDPWWEYGETMTDVCDHDVVFSRKVVEHGFRLYCDLDVQVDHTTGMTVRPVREKDGTWWAYIVQADRMFKMPAPSKPGVMK